MSQAWKVLETVLGTFQPSKRLLQCRVDEKRFAWSNIVNKLETPVIKALQWERVEEASVRIFLFYKQRLQDNDLF